MTAVYSGLNAEGVYLTLDLIYPAFVRGSALI